MGIIIDDEVPEAASVDGLQARAFAVLQRIMRLNTWIDERDPYRRAALLLLGGLVALSLLTLPVLVLSGVLVAINTSLLGGLFLLVGIAGSALGVLLFVAVVAVRAMLPLIGRSGDDPVELAVHLCRSLAESVWASTAFAALPSVAISVGVAIGTEQGLSAFAIGGILYGVAMIPIVVMGIVAGLVALIVLRAVLNGLEVTYNAMRTIRDGGAMPSAAPVGDAVAPKTGLRDPTELELDFEPGSCFNPAPYNDPIDDEFEEVIE